MKSVACTEMNSSFLFSVFKFLHNECDAPAVTNGTSPMSKLYPLDHHHYGLLSGISRFKPNTLNDLLWKTKGIAHPNKDISLIYCSLFFGRRLWWHFLVLLIVLEFHGGREFWPMATTAAMDSSVKKNNIRKTCLSNARLVSCKRPELVAVQLNSKWQR